MEMRSAIPIDRADIGAGKRLDALAATRLIVEVVVEQATPPSANTDHLDTGVSRAVYDRLDTWIQTWNVTTAG
jgi:hypothetical protein